MPLSRIRNYSAWSVRPRARAPWLSVQARTSTPRRPAKSARNQRQSLKLTTVSNSGADPRRKNSPSQRSDSMQDNPKPKSTPKRDEKSSKSWRECSKEEKAHSLLKHLHESQASGHIRPKSGDKA